MPNFWTFSKGVKSFFFFFFLRLFLPYESETLHIIGDLNSASPNGETYMETVT